MNEGSVWALIFAAGLITFLTRLAFIAVEGHYAPPPWFRRWMLFVPVAALTALTVPDLLLQHGQVSLDEDNRRLWAGVIAALIAARWRNTLLTIASGFVALWALRLWLG